jgi:hypothetical protein
VNRYGLAVDSQQWQLFDSIFVPGAQLLHVNVIALQSILRLMTSSIYVHEYTGQGRIRHISHACPCGAWDE